MPNLDTTYGVHNKLTKEIKYYHDPIALPGEGGSNGEAFPTEDLSSGDYFLRTDEDQLYRYDGSDWIVIHDKDSVVAQSFSGNVETAKSTIFHADALTNNDTNGTQIQYAITADGNGIKFTIAFGTKGASDIDPADDWAAIWATTKTSLCSAEKWVKPVTEQYWTATDETPHLF